MKLVKLLFLILICGSFLHAEYQYVFDKDKQCSVYDDIEKDLKNVEVFWSGQCKDQKAQGYGIAILSKEVNGTRVPFFRYEGKIVDGKYEGEAFLKWYETGDKGSFNFLDGVLEGEANLMTRNGEVFLNGKYTNGKFTLNKKATINTNSEEAFNAFIKARKPAYQYEGLLEEKLSQPCEYDEHRLKARKYDGHRLIAPAFRSLITCYSENKRYKEALNLYKEALKYPKADNKFFRKMLHRPLAFAYYGVGKYEESFKHLEKISNSAITKETLVLLESKKFTPYDTKRKKLLKKFVNLANNKMLKAIRSSNVENLHQALKSGADVNGIYKKGRTPLIIAGNYNNAEIIEALIAAGADVNAQDNDGFTALMNASWDGNLDVVHVLIKNGANVDLKTKDKNTAIVFAIQQKRYKTALALSRKSKNLKYKNYRKESYLHLAVRNVTDESDLKISIMRTLTQVGRKVNKQFNKVLKYLSDSKRENVHLLELIKYLISAKLNIDQQDKNGNTALHIASQYNASSSIVKLLLNSGANVNIKNKENDTPAHLAAKNISKNSFRILLELIKAGANINQKNKYDGTVLHCASSNSIDINSIEKVKLLINAGAKINSKGGAKMNTPLLAAEYNTFEIVKVLINAGADIRITDKYGDDALQVFVGNDDINIISYLLKLGANVNSKDSLGLSPLHGAALQAKNPKIISLLLNKGAQINSLSHDKYTPLHYAAMSWFQDNNADVIRRLIKAGADKKARDAKGNTPFDEAKIHKKSKEIINLLRY